MYASGRVIGRKLEVADGDAREPIERLERNVLTQLHTVEDRTESREAERIGRDRPLEVLVVKQERRKVGELVLVCDRGSGKFTDNKLGEAGLCNSGLWIGTVREEKMREIFLRSIIWTRVNKNGG